MAMPIMDGLSTINALKKISPDVRIIAVSGLHDDSSMTRAAAAGVRYFLNKPCATGTLLKTLQEVLTVPVITKPIA